MDYPYYGIPYTFRSVGSIPVDQKIFHNVFLNEKLRCRERIKKEKNT